MDKLTDEEREKLKELLHKGARVDGKIGIGWGSAKIWIEGMSLITFAFIIFMVVIVLLFMEFKKDTAEQHRILIEQGEETIFLTSLTFEQRAALGIQMPASLARKIHKQQEQQQHNLRDERFKYVPNSR